MTMRLETVRNRCVFFSFFQQPRWACKPSKCWRRRRPCHRSTTPRRATSTGARTCRGGATITSTSLKVRGWCLFCFCFVLFCFFFASVSPLLLQSLSGAGGGVTFCPFRCYRRCHKQIDPLHLSSSSVRIRNVASTTNRPVEQLRLTGHDVDVLVQCVHLFPPSFFFVALLLLLLVFFRVFYWMVFLSPLFYGRHHYRYCSCAAVAFGSPIGRSANVRPIRCQSLCGSSNPVRVF